MVMSECSVSDNIVCKRALVYIDKTCIDETTDVSDWPTLPRRKLVNPFSAGCDKGSAVVEERVGALILDIAAVTGVYFMILVLKDTSFCTLQYNLRNCDM